MTLTENLKKKRKAPPRLYFIELDDGTKMTVGFSGPSSKKLEEAWSKMCQLNLKASVKRPKQ